MVELLAPAGSSESLRAAVNAGADAVYIGGSMFGARAYADNPDEQALIEGIEFCHLHGRKLYMTVNTLLKEKEIETKLYDYLLPYYENGVDGLIVQDLGVVQFVHEQFPGLEVHASTQMTVTGSEGARLLQKQGITRVVPARELSLEEIRRIIDETGIEVETFIHGAMCYSYSGQCLLSSMIGGRSGNRGRCAQPCRLPYTLVEYGDSNSRGMEEPGLRKGKGVDNGKRGNRDVRETDRRRNQNSYILSMKDMCTLDVLPDLIDCGIASMKIEGRMKRPEYTAGVVSVYRKYIDLYLQKGRRQYRVEEDDRRILMDLYNRGGFSKGYYFMHNGPEMMSMERPNHFGTEAVRIKQVMNGKVKGVALEPLHKKDLLELSAGNEITMSQDVAKGETITLTTGRAPVQQGTVLNRTKNEWLLQSLESQFLKENVKEKIKGDLRIYAGRPAILKLTYGDFCVEVSEVIAEPAQNNPTPLASVEKQMKKTGNTPFVFEALQIDLDEGLFVSVRQLNELRRKGIDQLTEEILNGARRNKPDVAKRVEDKLVKNTNKELGNEFASVSESDCSVENMQKQEKFLEGVGQAYMGQLRLNLLVTSKEQLQAVLEQLPEQTDTVYLDSMVFAEYVSSKRKGAARDGRTEAVQEVEASCLTDAIQILQAKGIRVFFSFPPVFRKKERELMERLERSGVLELMDGFLLHTVDELSWAKDYQVSIEEKRDFQKEEQTSGQPVKKCRGSLILAADDTFYAYNCRAAAFLKSQGISRITLPAELNYHELSMLDTRGTELNVYGYQALMHSAQCVTKNTKGCTKRPSVIRLRDRKRAEFPVLNRCNVCCNTIYNSVPLQLGDCSKEIEQLQAGFVRLSFTIESAAETKQVLQQYTDLIFGNSVFGCAGRTASEDAVTDLEGTRGHFRRGVE